MEIWFDYKQTMLIVIENVCSSFQFIHNTYHILTKKQQLFSKLMAFKDLRSIQITNDYLLLLYYVEKIMWYFQKSFILIWKYYASLSHFFSSIKLIRKLNGNYVSKLYSWMFTISYTWKMYKTIKINFNLKQQFIETCYLAMDDTRTFFFVDIFVLSFCILKNHVLGIGFFQLTLFKRFSAL